MDLDSITFAVDVEPSNQERQEAKQAEWDAVVAEHNKDLRIKAKQHGMTIISPARVSRVAINPVSQLEYSCRKYALLNIIRNPELTESRYPLADSWRALYPDIPYNEKATNWNISKKDRDEMVLAMKEAGSWKHIELKRVRHFVDRVNQHYLANKVIKLEKRIKVLELQLADNGNVWYRGVEIVKLARTFKVVLDETTIETRHGTFDKLFEFLGQIDERLLTE